MTEEYRTALLQQITGLRERLRRAPSDELTVLNLLNNLLNVLAEAVTALLVEGGAK